MSFQRSRRGFVLAATSSLVLAACGGGGDDIVDQVTPTRLLAFGDGFSDTGRNGARYTVNGLGRIWNEQVAARYGVGITSYAAGNARIVAGPDAAGGAAPTIADQIGGFLGGGAFGSGDMVLVSGGVSDVIVQARAVIDGAQSGDAARENVRLAGRELGAQVRRLVGAGARYVVVAGTYNLGRSPWARSIRQEGLLENLSSNFNEALLISIADQGSRVLYVDLAFYFNLVTANPGSYSLDDSTTVVCNTVDAGPGIGIGNGQVNSALCNTGTLTRAEPNRYLFADAVYPTPRGHQLFGDYAYDRIRSRF